MRFWLATVVLLFVLSQLLMWLKQFFTPIPLYIFAGAALAIASNYHLLQKEDEFNRE